MWKMINSSISVPNTRASPKAFSEHSLRCYSAVMCIPVSRLWSFSSFYVLSLFFPFSSFPLFISSAMKILN